MRNSLINTQQALVPIDDLTKIKGIGEQRQQVLNGLGIYSYRQLIEADARELAPKVGALTTAAMVEQWQRQAEQMEG